MPQISSQQCSTGLAQFSADLVQLRPALYRHARRLCNNADLAEDLVQDTMLRAMDRRSNFTQGTNLKAWTFTILRNIYFAHWHKEKRLAGWDPRLDDSITISGGQEEAATLTEIVERMKHMPPAQRDALALVGVGGCSYDEAAEIGQCAVGTMKSRVSRARAALSAAAPSRAVSSAGSGFAALLVLCGGLLAGARRVASDDQPDAVSPSGDSDRPMDNEVLA